MGAACSEGEEGAEGDHQGGGGEGGGVRPAGGGNGVDICSK